MAAPNTTEVAFEPPYFPTLLGSSPDMQPRHSVFPPTSLDSSRSPPFYRTEICHQIQTEDGRRIQPEINCEINEGFFFSSEGIWTTYRRSYFAVDCSYLLQPDVESHQLFLAYGDDEAAPPVRERIQSIAISLSAENDKGRAIELIQHTPKRDKGPQQTIGFVPLWPTSLQPEKSAMQPYLPLQEGQRPGSAGVDIRHSFKRIQFKSATANNGKRRALQQYYHVKVDLYCDIRSSADHAPRWIKSAQRHSFTLVVRGRSPGNYEHLGNSSVGSSGPGRWKAEEVGPPAVSPTQKNHQTTQQVPLFGNPNCGPILGPDSADRGNYPELPSSHLEDEPNAEVRSISTQDVLDDSSISTCLSHTDGSSRPRTQTSASSVDGVLDIAEQFTQLILEINGIRSLLKACFAEGQGDRTQRNLHRLLKRFTVRLHSEGIHPVDIIIARALKRQSRRITNALKDHLEPKQGLNARLALDQLPDSRGYALTQFMADRSAEPVSSKGINMPNSAESPILQLKDPNAPNKGSYKVPKVIFNAATTALQREAPAEVKVKKLSQVGIDNEEDPSSDESDEKSEEHAFGNHGEILSTEVERGKAFLRNSEALEEFREDILDLLVGLENARQNQRIFEMDTKEANETQYQVFKTDPFLSNFQTTWHRALRNLRRAIRPGPKTGTRRIEWACECGEELFADFNNEDRTALDALEAALHQSAAFTDTTIETSNSVPQARSSTEGGDTTALSTSSPQQQSCYAPTTGNDPVSAIGTQSNMAAAQQASCSPRHLAICISAGGIYKCLSEIDVSKMKTDSQLFLTIADIYRSSSTSLSPWKMLLKPVSVEFVLLSVWDTRGGYISIFDRPRCVPPEDDTDYDFNPRPLKPLPPVPPEIFLHYIQKHIKPSGDIFLCRPVWTPRLPTRKGKRLIDCDVGTHGWGIYIREGPNRLFVFWMVILSVVCSVLLSLLWVGLKGDVQGASGLGTLILGVHSVVMAAFMFKFGELQ